MIPRPPRRFSRAALAAVARRLLLVLAVTLTASCGLFSGGPPDEVWILNGSSGPVWRSPDPIPPDQGNVLRAVRRGIDVELSFVGAAATLWRLYHDPDKLSLGTTPLLPDAVTTTYLDVGAIPRTGSEYYQLRGLSPCSLTPGP